MALKGISCKKCICLTVNFPFWFLTASLSEWIKTCWALSLFVGIYAVGFESGARCEYSVYGTPFKWHKCHFYIFSVNVCKSIAFDNINRYFSLSFILFLILRNWGVHIFWDDITSVLIFHSCSISILCVFLILLFAICKKLRRYTLWGGGGSIGRGGVPGGLLCSPTLTRWTHCYYLGKRQFLFQKN